MSDLISRQAAINITWDNPSYYDPLNVLTEVRERIKTLPSIERKKGKWIEKDVIHKDEAQDVIEEWQSAKCSACGKYHTTPYMYYFDEYKYCPNCGADMRADKRTGDE